MRFNMGFKNNQIKVSVVLKSGTNEIKNTLNLKNYRKLLIFAHPITNRESGIMEGKWCGSSVGRAKD